MKILFVHSGNSLIFPTSPFIYDQALSIKKLGHEVDFYAVKGKSICGYLANVRHIRRYIKTHDFDIIHAHYSLCGLVAVLALTGKPIVCSFMGNDILGEYNQKGKLKYSSVYLIVISLLIQPFLKHVICKSENISKMVFFSTFSIIPNGVDVSIFKPMIPSCRSSEKTILFLGDPESVNKNIRLLYDALKLLPNNHIKVLTPYPVDHDSLPMYFNEADVFVLCSIVEGSPNVVKEAMACNCPIVATDVGNVKWLLGEVDQHYVVKHNPMDMAEKIKLVLENGKRSNGRSRLIELQLDSQSVANKIIDVYKKSLKR